MGKLPKYGVNVYHKRTKKKRPGRHAKSNSKRKPHKKKNRGQYGVNVYHKRTKKKRPGRHAKSNSKRKPHKKKNRGQGR